MTINLSMPLSRQPDYVKLPKNMSVKSQSVAVQHWKKAFDDAMAKNSICENIAPETKTVEYQKASISQTHTDTAHTTRVDLSDKGIKTQPQPALMDLANTSKSQDIPLNAQRQNIQKSIMDLSFGQQNNLFSMDAESSASIGIKMETSQYIRMAGNTPESEFPILNLFMFVDQDKARLWVRDNQIERSQSEAVLAKLKQSLRAKNIALSSLVVNGYRIF